MKRIMIIGIALLAGGSLFAQSGSRKPVVRTFTCVTDKMKPDNVTARPWPIHYQGTPAVGCPVVQNGQGFREGTILPAKPNYPVARPITEKMKPY